MKAWRVHVKDEPYSTVVFAETRGKARSLALHTDACEYVNFTDIEVHRFKQADSQYNGRKEMEWDNPQDRLFLVKQGWFCAEDFIVETDCDSCCAKEYCEVYLDRSDEDKRPCQNGLHCVHEYFDYEENCKACRIDFDGFDCPYIKQEETE